MTQPHNSTFPSLSCAAYNEQNIPMEREALQEPAEEAAMERPPSTAGLLKPFIDRAHCILKYQFISF